MWWQKQYISQFVITPKPSRAEKEKGLENMPMEKITSKGRKKSNDTPGHRGETPRKNTHPTIKPIKLMAHLITMESRKGDTILDPFAGSGTTGIAATLLQRNYILIEQDSHNCKISTSRIKHWQKDTRDAVKKTKPRKTMIAQQTLETFV